MDFLWTVSRPLLEHDVGVSMDWSSSWQSTRWSSLPYDCLRVQEVIVAIVAISVDFDFINVIWT